MGSNMDNTPWTLPANVAISLNPDFEYGVYKTEKGNLILGKDLAEKAFTEMDLEQFELIKEFQGKDLERATYQHPFLERTGMIILGTHVTADAGTGCVHTAPGHGQDDYVVGVRYGLPVISPINNKGVLTEEAGEFAGLFYVQANKAICAHLEKTGHLMKLKMIEHSYPHDWRSKTPVIFRATEQWFVNVEGSDIREKALKALDNVEFIPAGEEIELDQCLKQDLTGVSQDKEYGECQFQYSLMKQMEKRYSIKKYLQNS